MNLNPLTPDSPPRLLAPRLTTPRAQGACGLEAILSGQRAHSGREQRHTTYLLEGRREVWCRIRAHLQLTEEDVLSCRGW